ncbi:VirB4 family type IV secretion/conjugal transfer ATPase [Burkholderia pseudomallei]|uniref:VirB4 family type IV secretion/conjugal transfer ATPase n=1 Tax=Burkholderia pseudomallei TaxID=28450 RepID=UPI000F1736F7|nr:type VI secretion protein [Burkholderia pseudomallei]CAJ3267429.1 Type IV secretion system protein VirB4 [Burkholderia pseudomallei]CAJ5189343.1 Type IV secretion system protein VirB4 [Burkholderia pseudomallei]CAJ5784419.1 Type IV secretion system protein VirB4 [Burkholderia pseudomallei]CAJ6336157.1 Type IV secretion system protein VirB4 [Burkholderia pseudomallei]CAJ6593432.1 Type IV secretion system protein VirB4 [Burkholderia pseudomallei]
MRLVDVLKEKFDMSLSMPLPDGAAIDDKEMAASDMIPYTVHYDDETVITKDDGLVQVIEIDGLYFESFSAEQIKQFERRRNTVLRSIANSDRAVYVHMIRRKVNQYPEGEGETWFSRRFNAAWRERYNKRSFYVNKIYISIVRNRFRQGAPGLLDRVFSLVSGAKASTEDLESFEEQAKDLNEAANLVVQTLSGYGARKLRIQRRSEFVIDKVAAADAQVAIERFKLSWRDFLSQYGVRDVYDRDDVYDYLGADYSEIAGFFHYLINLEDERVPVSDMQLDRTLAVSWLDFKTVGNMMAVQNLTGTRAGAVLSMAEWPSRTPSRMLNEFLKQPVEYIVTQSFFFTDRITAEHDMKQERRRLVVNDREGGAEEDQKEITAGLRDLTSGRAVNGLHHLTILAHVPATTTHFDPVENKRQTIADLDKAVALLKKSFVNLGVKAVREWFAVETFFWSQLPGQAQHFIGRRGKIKSSNFAGFASLHNYAVGKIDGNLWGPAIMVFETESGTQYAFNFHREMEGMVAGHLALTADTGGGKTTLLSVLTAMADKARPRVFWFDNREGAKVFMRAMGGQHTTLSVQGSTGWNPFKLPDSPENRLYLVELMTLMRTCYGGKLVPDDIERFKKAVHENYELRFEDRRLRNVAWCFGQGELAKDMRIWHGANGAEGANWGVFDNEHDSIDLTQCRHYCFEMRQLIKDGVARPELPVVLSYPFHRIEQSMNGEPFILVLEEGQNLVKHAYWREKIDSYIMQIRRKNGLLIFVTPDAKYLYCETDSIQKQTATKIYLPNGEASKVDLVDHLGLTVGEFDFIHDTPPESFKFLIRRGSESIRVVFDLSDMPEFIPVLSSNDKGVALMEQIISELGTDDPEQWVPVFMQRAIAENTHNLKKKGA